MVIKKSREKTESPQNTIYICEKCGLKLKVEESSCYYTEKDIHNILCCGQPMKPVKSIINQSGDA